MNESTKVGLDLCSTCNKKSDDIDTCQWCKTSPVCHACANQFDDVLFLCGECYNNLTTDSDNSEDITDRCDKCNCITTYDTVRSCDGCPNVWLCKTCASSFLTVYARGHIRLCGKCVDHL
jgi:hypothetical protein